MCSPGPALNSYLTFPDNLIHHTYHRPLSYLLWQIWTSCGENWLCHSWTWYGPAVVQINCAYLYLSCTSCVSYLLWLGPAVVRGRYWHKKSEGGTATGDPREALPQEVRGRHCHRRSKGGTATGSPRGALPQEVQGRHCHRKFEGGNMAEATAGPYEVCSVNSRCTRRPDSSGLHSRSL